MIVTTLVLVVLGCVQSQERRAYEMRRARTGAYGDGRVGPVDTMTLQREMRRKALLDQMKNNAWS